MEGMLLQNVDRALHALEFYREFYANISKFGPRKGGDPPTPNLNPQHTHICAWNDSMGTQTIGVYIYSSQFIFVVVMDPIHLYKENNTKRHVLECYRLDGSAMALCCTV